MKQKHICVTNHADLPPIKLTVVVPFNGLFSRTTWVSKHQKGKTILDMDFKKARDDGVAVASVGPYTDCASLQTDNHASTTSLKFFYGPDALPDAQPTMSKC